MKLRIYRRSIVFERGAMSFGVYIGTNRAHWWQNLVPCRETFHQHGEVVAADWEFLWLRLWWDAAQPQTVGERGVW